MTAGDTVLEVIQEPIELVVDRRQEIVLEVAQVGTRGLRGLKGDKGDAGDSGDSTIGGYPAVITDPQVNDALLYNGAQFVNVPQTEFVDGGNF